MLRVVLPLLCLSTSAKDLAAQTAIYGEFTGGTVPASDSKWMFGPTVGLYHDNGLGLLALGYDVRGSFLRRGDTAGASTNESLNLLEGGVRAAITPHVLPIKPYVEELPTSGPDDSKKFILSAPRPKYFHT